MAATNVHHRKDGRWEARITYENEFGVMKRKAIYARTRAELKEKVFDFETKNSQTGWDGKTCTYTLKEWMEIWIREYCINRKPTTVDAYRRNANRYIYPLMGDAKLVRLSRVNVQMFCNQLGKGYRGQEPLNPKTIVNVHGILHSALKRAVILGFIDKNPADFIELPKVRKPQLKPLMDDNIRKYVERVKDDKYGNLLIIDLFTGMRRSEIIGLTWDDVDLEKGIITVRRQIQKIGGQKEYIYLNETKNGKSREIPVCESVVTMLQRQRRQQSAWRLAAGREWNETGLVFTDEYGNHVKHHNVYKHHKKAVADIGLPECRLHDLRHSCVIMALQNGVDVKSVQLMMGHYSASFTLDVYGNVSNTMKKQTQDKMEYVFKSCVGNI